VWLIDVHLLQSPTLAIKWHWKGALRASWLRHSYDAHRDWHERHPEVSCAPHALEPLMLGLAPEPPGKPIGSTRMAI
jgi:hypothetical protein